jgi:hypothetical protein
MVKCDRFSCNVWAVEFGDVILEWIKKPHSVGFLFTKAIVDPAASSVVRRPCVGAQDIP